MRNFLRAFTVLIGLWCLTPLAIAATQQTPIYPQLPKNTKTCFIQGTDSAGTYKTIYTGDADGSKVVAVWAGTNDDVSHLVTVRHSTSTADHCATNGTCGSGASATVAATAGYADGVPVENMLGTNWPGLPSDSDGNLFIYISDNTQTLEATFATAFSTAGEHVCLNVLAVDF